MNKKIYIIVMVILIIIGFVIGYIYYDENKIVSTITLDINPSIEINLNKREIIKNVVAINDDAKSIISENVIGKTIEDGLNDIFIKVIEKEYATENGITIIMYSKGIIDRNTVINKINNYFRERGINIDLIVIDTINTKDEELSLKYNISVSKAAYINLIDNDKVAIEDMINKSASELMEMKETGFYCDKGYNLEMGECLKEIERTSAIKGDVCPRGYFEYNGICYEEKPIENGTKDICNDDSKLEDGKCIKITINKAQGVCDSGEYDYEKDKCVEHTYIGDAYEFCRDSGRTLYEHKCLATKPTINGKCLGKDKLLNGKCVNTINDYYAAEWKCPNGKVNSNADGSLLFPDNKCYEEKKTTPSSYKCEEGFILGEKLCTKTEIESTRKEQFCPSGYDLVRNDKCINYNISIDKERGYYCEDDRARLKNNECIVYDILNAKHN